MSDRFGDLTPLQPESGAGAAGGDTVPARGIDSLPQSPLEGTAGLGEAPGMGGGRDTVPFRGDSTPLPDAPDSSVPGLGDAAPGPGDSAVPGSGDAAPGLGDSAVPGLGDAAPSLGDAAPAMAALDGGAGQTLAEAVHAVEGATELDGAGPGLERDLGEFVDGAGQGWDIQSPADIFGSGPDAGERMPDDQPGRYDGDVFENQLDGALAKGLNVVVDTSGLSKDANADARRRADERPDWAGRVRFE
ncbi:hypothetical protein ACPPVO_30760 [Dactylosporangium sp. McL0621]|uniref:hypothetical protein n=1 Tax=Dactylosporangium sp. McL0621 TaxID=3415678 RepID=UPI003CE7C4F6